VLHYGRRSKFAEEKGSSKKRKKAQTGLSMNAQKGNNPPRRRGGIRTISSPKDVLSSRRRINYCMTVVSGIRREESRREDEG